VLDLARKETSLSRIGIVLRDEYGIPDVKLITGKSLKKTLEGYEIKTELPDDLRDLMVGALNIREHYAKNKNDKTALKGLQNTEARIRSLAPYYIKKGDLPKNWRYNPQRAKLLLGR
jgi:Ribosomal protein S15P/S13E